MASKPCMRRMALWLLMVTTPQPNTPFTARVRPALVPIRSRSRRNLGSHGPLTNSLEPTFAVHWFNRALKLPAHGLSLFQCQIHSSSALNLAKSSAVRLEEYRSGRGLFRLMLYGHCH